MNSGRGLDWLAIVALALAAASLSVVQAGPLILVPVSLLILALPPRKPLLTVLGALIIAATLTATFTGPLANLDRGWPLLLGGWFVLIAAFWPSAAFLPRGLAAVAASTVSAAGLLGLSGGGWSRLDDAVASQMQAAAAQVAAMITVMTAGRGATEVAEQLTATVYMAANFQRTVFPALLAIASLAALAVAWWAYRRLACGERRPLAPLREFRFDDNLIWLVIAGVVLVLIPAGDGAVRTGANVLVFMGVLYTVRGIAIVLSTIGPAPLGVIAATVAAMVFPRVVAAALLLVGLSDTWLDIRTRRRAAAGRES